MVPIFNSEIYIVASQVGGFTEEVTTAVGCAVGQAIGKVGTVLAPGGQSFQSGATAGATERPRKPAGRVRTKLRAWSDRLLGLLSKPRWSSDRLSLRLSRYSAAVRSDLAVPATRMSVIPFGVAVLLGRMLLYLAIAFGVSALID